MQKRSFPAGAYDRVTDEELTNGRSFAAYRRVASWITTPEQNSSSATELIVIDTVKLVAAHVRDVECINLSDEYTALTLTANRPFAL